LNQLLKMDRKVKSSRIQALFNRQLASLGIPKSIHCLALRLAEEFSVNAEARSPVPLPQHAPRLTDTSRLHVALVTDNILAAAVAVASAVSSSADPSRLVFHVVTDKKSYVPMHSWFALHPVSPAVVEVKGLHQFDWRDGDAIASVMRTIDEVQKSSLGYHQLYDGAAEREVRRLEASKPSTFSPLNYLKIHLPEVNLRGEIHVVFTRTWPQLIYSSDAFVCAVLPRAPEDYTTRRRCRGAQGFGRSMGAGPGREHHGRGWRAPSRCRRWDLHRKRSR
jgi:hypothetical protein